MLKDALKKVRAAIKPADKKKVGGEIEILPDDVFLVSYPKSGNTWLLFIFANLMYKDDNINFTNIHNYSYEAGKPYDIVIDPKPPRIVKSHGLFEPSYPKVVYVVRDGRDVYVSYYNYLKNKLPAGMTFKDFLKEGSMPYGRWCDHISSWLDNIKSPMFVVSYEELHLDPLKTVRKIVDFIGMEADDKDISVAIAKSTFDNMKKAEAMHGRGQRKSGPEVFMRKGQVGDWKLYFGEEEKKIFKAIENEALVRLNYEENTNW